jgi:hypothetical protein
MKKKFFMLYIILWLITNSCEKPQNLNQDKLNTKKSQKNKNEKKLLLKKIKTKNIKYSNIKIENNKFKAILRKLKCIEKNYFEKKELNVRKIKYTSIIDKYFDLNHMKYSNKKYIDWGNEISIYKNNNKLELSKRYRNRKCITMPNRFSTNLICVEKEKRMVVNPFNNKVLYKYMRVDDEILIGQKCILLHKENSLEIVNFVNKLKYQVQFSCKYMDGLELNNLNDGLFYIDTDTKYKIFSLDFKNRKCHNICNLNYKIPGQSSPELVEKHGEILFYVLKAFKWREELFMYNCKTKIKKKIIFNRAKIRDIICDNTIETCFFIASDNVFTTDGYSHSTNLKNFPMYGKLKKKKRKDILYFSKIDDKLILLKKFNWKSNLGMFVYNFNEKALLINAEEQDRYYYSLLFFP